MALTDVISWSDDRRPSPSRRGLLRRPKRWFAVALVVLTALGVWVLGRDRAVVLHGFDSQDPVLRAAAISRARNDGTATDLLDLACDDKRVPVIAAATTALYHVTGHAADAPEPKRRMRERLDDLPVYYWLPWRTDRCQLLASRIHGIVDLRAGAARVTWTLVASYQDWLGESPVWFSLPRESVVTGLVAVSDRGATGAAAWIPRAVACDEGDAWQTLGLRAPASVLTSESGGLVLTMTAPQGRLESGTITTSIDMVIALEMTQREARLSLPAIDGAVPQVADDLQHEVRLQCTEHPSSAASWLVVSTDVDARFALAGDIPQAASAARRGEAILRWTRDSGIARVWSKAPHGGADDRVVCDFTPAADGNVVLVVDGSRILRPKAQQIHAAVARALAVPRVRAVLAVDAGFEDLDATRLGAQLAPERFVGGRDNVPALLHATEQAGPNGRVVWLFGPQPLLLTPFAVVRAARDRVAAEEPITAIALERGPQHLLAEADHHDCVWELPRHTDLAAQVEHLAGPRDVLVRRWRSVGLDQTGLAPELEVNADLALLQARAEVGALLARSPPDLRAARRLAVAHRIVTPVSGVVVEWQGARTPALFHAACPLPRRWRDDSSISVRSSRPSCGWCSRSSSCWPSRCACGARDERARRRLSAGARGPGRPAGRPRPRCPPTAG